MTNKSRLLAVGAECEAMLTAGRSRCDLVFHHWTKAPLHPRRREAGCGATCGRLALMPSDWLTPKQAGAVMRPRRGERWVQRLIQRGDLRATRFGARWIVARADAVAYKPRPRGRPACG